MENYGEDNCVDINTYCFFCKKQCKNNRGWPVHVYSNRHYNNIYNDDFRENIDHKFELVIWAYDYINKDDVVYILDYLNRILRHNNIDLDKEIKDENDERNCRFIYSGYLTRRAYNIICVIMKAFTNRKLKR